MFNYRYNINQFNQNPQISISWSGYIFKLVKYNQFLTPKKILSYFINKNKPKFGINLNINYFVYVKINNSNITIIIIKSILNILLTYQFFLSNIAKIFIFNLVFIKKMKQFAFSRIEVKEYPNVILGFKVI